jgi:predicted aminopeptidase
VNPAISLCAHLAGDALAALPVAPDDALEWHDGPIVAVVRCPACGRAGLIELLDWAAGGRTRIYALAGIDPAAVALYQRNVARGSCDLARRQREAEALIASAGRPERLVARDTDGAVVRSVAWPADLTMPAGTWQERVQRGDAAWRERVGLE